MKAIDGLELIRTIKDGEIEENTRIIVLEDNKEYDVYDVVAELTYKGGETLWSEGTFRLSMLYDKKHFFEIIEEEKEIEEINIWYEFDGKNNDEIIYHMCTELKDKINELVREINGLKKEGK